jgi:hypothetical protein
LLVHVQLTRNYRSYELRQYKKGRNKRTRELQIKTSSFEPELDRSRVSTAVGIGPQLCR